MPTLNALELKAYAEKITSQLDQAKGKLQEMEGYFKEKKAAAELETIRSLRTAQKDIERRIGELKTAAEAKTAQIKAEIDSSVANVNAKVAQLASKAHQKVG
jgi:TolA-binding protein